MFLVFLGVSLLLLGLLELLGHGAGRSVLEGVAASGAAAVFGGLGRHGSVELLCCFG